MCSYSASQTRRPQLTPYQGATRSLIEGDKMEAHMCWAGAATGPWALDSTGQTQEAQSQERRGTPGSPQVLCVTKVRPGLQEGP